MMLHQDGSKHIWLAGQPALDLIITMDDATSEIYSAAPLRADRRPRRWEPGALVDEDGTMSSFCGLVEVIERHGLFMELYTDRGSHYFFTPEAGGKVSRTQLTQIGRALKQLGIGHIPAYSPEARGCCERAFRTLQARRSGATSVVAPGTQARLTKELALARITTVEVANRSYARSTCPTTTPASPSPPRSRPRPSSRCPRRSGAKPSASRKSAGSATATACAGMAAA